ncbi:MAG: proline dehydrogenase family protein [Pirellulaceae bacterium]|nr:proline dehydrogenase family protein [Pirellulaceae bacterium]
MNWPEELPIEQRRELERRTVQIGRQLFESLADKRLNILQRRWWDERIMQWAMRDEQLKVQLFRFVDVLPMLHTPRAVIGHLDQYLEPVRHRLPAAARTALDWTRGAAAGRSLLAQIARLSAMDFARRFIAGSNVGEVLEAARRERQLKRGFTLDILGEAVISDSEAERYFGAYLELLEGTARVVNAWSEEPQVDHDSDGPLPRVNLSVKLSALDCHFDAVDAAGVLRRAGGRLRELLRAARQQRAFINIDMESYEKKALTLEVFRSVLLEPEFRDFRDVGIVIQCYLRDAAQDLVELRDWAAARGCPVWVRLVKGAYWDYETIHARANGWPVPVFQRKWQSDACFEWATRFVLRNRAHLRPALGSHNLRSIAQGLAAAELLEVPPHGLELQMLYGMADQEKRALVERGHRLRIYMPYGELIPGMAYLVRRLLENTSNDSFLRAGFIEHISIDQLLRDPLTLESTDQAAQGGPAAAGEAAAAARSAAAASDAQGEEMTMSSMGKTDTLKATFRNHPPVDFAVAANRQAMLHALQEVLPGTGRKYPLVIGPDELVTSQTVLSRDPSQQDRIVGEICLAAREHVERAVAASQSALPDWSARTADERGRYLRAAADVMSQRFFELAAWEVYECGKPWREATGDICEAIDFCRFYADEAVALERPQGADVPGEQNRFEYRPRGVTAVIAPWNFPLAILTGMTAAALATGNTVVMKPAEQSSTVAAKLMEIFRQVQLPAGVANYLPGRGEEVGAALVEHPQVALIAFTGSRQVGLAINAQAAQVSARGIGHVKRVIAEMGGKNALIIDDDADLDEAVLGTVASAFGYQGQKCSACSRAIVLRGVYDAFLPRLVAAARSLKVGPAQDPETQVGPLIDAAARDKVFDYIELGRQEGREVLATDIGPLASRGYYVGPHIYADVPPAARIAQEEVFGPVLAVIPVANLDEALRVANDTDYALTGGIYSRSPANLERVRRELQVGNLYLNRPITGAIVGRQPFGGYKLSGIGSKAGGKDYLLQFVLPRTITENTLRRGFAPPDE